MEKSNKKVKCIGIVPEDRICRQVTIGKEYDVQFEDGDHYKLVDDTGNSRYYERELFKVLAEHPQETTNSVEGKREAEIVCVFCSQHQNDSLAENFDMVINGKALDISYHAYSMDSSFGEEIPINFCPMCGKTL